MESMTLNISGMTCMGCVNSVSRVLRAIDGVHSVEVSLDLAQATIAYDSAIAQPVEFRRAIQDAGFETA